MKRVRLTLAALTLTGGLLGVAPQAFAASGDCPAQPIVGYETSDVTVGVKHAQTMDLLVTTDKKCLVSTAVAVVRSAHDNYRVTLHKQPGEPTDLEWRWTGSLTINPKQLRNSDAGIWPVSYRVDGETDQTLDVDRHVRRATRASFNAGPEPVRDNKLTFAGKLERADWNTRAYRGIGRTVTIEAYEDDNEGSLDIATTTTNKHGKYRVTKTFPGPYTYSMHYAGSSTTAATTGPVDRVAKP